ncbi:MAG: nitrate- and nitrite sensing domain-containing protein [Burkholderiaceae bacterium]
MSFLVAARRCEIHGLEQLTLTSSLVEHVSELVHRLQKERGASNIYLASGGKRFGDAIDGHSAASLSAEQAAVAAIELLDTQSGRMAGGVRLFSRIAWVLHSLEALPGLRERVRRCEVDAEQATRQFSELIAGWLAVVHEAADTAADAAVSRALVALFNLMQGKELAGQERAAAAVGFAAGHFEASRQQRLAHLIDAQERCFQLFAEFASPALRDVWRQAQAGAEIAEVERMRRLAGAASAARLAPDASERWFDCASARIDAMHQVESCAGHMLRQLCRERLAVAYAELSDHKRLLDSLGALDGGHTGTVAMVFARDSREVSPAALLPVDGLGPQLGRSVLELVQQQTCRLQQISDELSSARRALNERKLIERAKGLLMSSRGLSEDEAYKLLRQTAMNQNRRLVEVAEAALALTEVLRAG